MENKRYKLLICHHYLPEENLGGITSVMRNMDPYFREVFDVSYMTLPKKWQVGSTRASFFIYMWLHKKEFKKYDILLSHVPESSYFTVQSGMPNVHVYHGDGHPMKGGSWIKKPFVSFYDHILNTINTKCPLVYCVGKKRKPVDKKLYNPLIQDVKPLLIEQRSGFVFTGRLVDLKRVNRLIDVYSKLPEEIRKENKFTIVGDGYCREALEAQAKELGLQNQVIFLGSRPNTEMMKIVSDKKIVLMASTTEGFPTTIAEGFSVGVPAISTAVGSVASVLEDNVNGFTLPKDFDDDVYVKYIETVLNEYKRFSDAALESARLFNAERVTKGVISDMMELIKK
ncbi:MAG: glycosyltransferase [Bacteroidaceae bacterium]|nr:glycosyltransferase [Bacteroidaceae bacterium]